MRMGGAALVVEFRGVDIAEWKQASTRELKEWGRKTPVVC